MTVAATLVVQFHPGTEVEALRDDTGVIYLPALNVPVSAGDPIPKKEFRQEIQKEEPVSSAVETKPVPSSPSEAQDLTQFIGKDEDFYLDIPVENLVQVCEALGIDLSQYPGKRNTNKKLRTILMEYSADNQVAAEAQDQVEQEDGSEEEVSIEEAISAASEIFDEMISLWDKGEEVSLEEFAAKFSETFGLDETYEDDVMSILNSVAEDDQIDSEGAAKIFIESFFGDESGDENAEEFSTDEDLSFLEKGTKVEVFFDTDGGDTGWFSAVVEKIVRKTPHFRFDDGDVLPLKREEMPKIRLVS